ncbi:MAG: PqqD family protein [Bacteroidales bacterium]|nr:PqqD family protein [Bacteroidales bacterium]
MKIIEGFRLRKLGHENIVIGESVKLVNFNKMVVLNSSAAYLWESVIGKEFTVEDLTRLLIEHYEVDSETAAKDSAKLAADWKEAGIVEE